VIFSPNLTLKDLEKKIIAEALTHFDGNKTRAAKSLGISIRTMRNKINEYKLYEFKGLPSRRSY
jgi:DNA-binding NtrC family response regulator